MRNATIATSRTRATTEHLIDYRPLPAAWRDRAALQEVRAAKARVAERGLDPSTLEIAAPSEQHSHSAATTHRRRGGLSRTCCASSGVIAGRDTAAGISRPPDHSHGTRRSLDDQ